MSQVDTKLSAVEWTTVVGAGAVVLGGFYLAGFNYVNLYGLSSFISLVILGVLLWLVIAEKEKLATIVTDSQLIVLISTCVVALNVCWGSMTIMGNRGTFGK